VRAVSARDSPFATDDACTNISIGVVLRFIAQQLVATVFTPNNNTNMKRYMQPHLFAEVYCASAKTLRGCDK